MSSEASDAIRSWWIGEHISVNKLYSPVTGQRAMAIMADSEELHERAIQLGVSLNRAKTGGG